ncbi:baseplate J/gp47 family protein [Novosphingobium colocasiae]|uniref:Baseplate assembly protein n=1 Tax=Novosphingobium colocasiae TaxID=1256513 RepID=A0A918PET1_9SPHN|nr:baseplate J/gp47 family protein [Novosphingobium colocasiae]GGZ02724.1 baseplate assembly protein [Novosphingobium colocasiae]
MVGSIASSPAVDLSALPAPDLVPQPDFETRLAGKLARLIALRPEFTALVESDPAMKLLEADGYDELVLAEACNHAAKQLLLAFATGSNLDQLGALYDVERLTVTPATETTAAVMESDTAYRQRIQLAPHSFSVAGPELAYVYHARSAHGDVADATAVSPSPGEVVVTVLSASGDGVPSTDVLDAVNALLQGPIRPLTDHVIVQPAELVDFAIEAELYVFAGPDQALILETAQAALTAHLATVRRLGRDVARSALIAALHVGNVQRVNLISPADDIAITSHQIGSAVSIDVTIAGTEL